MTKANQVQNWLSEFLLYTSDTIAALDGLNASLRFYDAIGGDEAITPDMLTGGEHEGLNADQITQTVQGVRLLIETVRTSDVYAAALAILPAPPRRGR